MHLRVGQPLLNRRRKMLRRQVRFTEGDQYLRIRIAGFELGHHHCGVAIACTDASHIASGIAIQAKHRNATPAKHVQHLNEGFPGISPLVIEAQAHTQLAVGN